MFLQFAIFVLSITIFIRFKYSRRFELLAKIPSPKKRFLLHNVLEFWDVGLEKVFKNFEKWQKEYGDVFHFTLYPLDAGTFIVCDVKIAEALSLHKPDRSRSKNYEALSRWIGKGFFVSSGKELKNRMKPFAQVAHPKFYDEFMSIANAHLSESMKLLNGRVDVFAWSRDIALDVIFEATMGYQMNAKIGENAEFVDAVTRIGELVSLANLNALSSIRFLYDLTSIGKDETKTLKVLHDFTRKIVQDRRKKLAGSNNNDKWLMLDHFLLAEIDGKFYNDEEVRGELDTTILGGHDTTKVALAFSLYNLAKYPEVQRKVFEEAYQVFKDNLEEDVDEADVLKLVYTEAFIKETMRTSAPVPYVGRKIDSEITVDGYTFPKDAEVLFSPYLIGRSSKYFKDPLTFDPTRFLGNETVPLGYVPFSIGMRKCIGQKITYMGLKIFVAKIARKFVLSLTPGHEHVNVASDIVLHATDGIILTFEKREA